MTQQTGRPVTVTITRLGRQGDGLARLGGQDLFVAGALPGETVEGIPENGRIPAPRIMTPSASRVAPPCPHARSCGGCALQHAADEFVAAWKREQIERALKGHGIAATVLPPVTSPPRSRRRATLAGRRTKKGTTVGFHARRSDRIVEIPGCILLHPDLMATLPALHALTRAGGSRKGEVLFALTRSEAGVDVAARGGRDLDAGLLQQLAAIAREARLARLTWNEEPVVQIAPPAQRFGPARVVPPPGGFLQATAEGEAALVGAVLEDTAGATRVADLFAGAGTFSLPLARHRAVTAVESDAAALAALDRGWRETPGLKPVATEQRDLFRRPLLAAELARFDAVVLDPPRAGAAAQCRELATSPVGRIVHVSCNPASFARDAATLLAGGYRIGPVLPVDQFRWSPHVELVATFTRHRPPPPA